MRNLFLAGILSALVGIANGQTMYVPGGTATGIGNNTSNSNVGIGTSTKVLMRLAW